MVTRAGGEDWVAEARGFSRDFPRGLHGTQALPAFEKYWGRRWGRWEEFAGWIREDALASLSIEQALGLYSASGGAKRKEFAGNPLEDVRESLDFLLYDAVKLEGRFQECAAQDGAYKLEGAGKEFVSYLLCVKDPATFAVWNSAAERAMRKLNLPTQRLSKGVMGVAYAEFLNDAYLLRRRLGLPDFRALDAFSYSVTRSPSPGGA